MHTRASIAATTPAAITGTNTGTKGRRQFLVNTSAAGLALATGATWWPSAARASSAMSLPPLPFAEQALDPVISAQTLSFHYGKHHKGYFDNLVKLIQDTPQAEQSLESLITSSAGQPAKTALFNNAGQVWNHTFYWQGLRAKGGGVPPAALKQKIEQSFGSVDALRQELAKAAAAQFGSGWVWLVLQDGQLKVTRTGGGDSPLTVGARPLLALDVWEHAYYLDYQNRRVDHIHAVTDKLVNWGFVQDNLG
jgi:superoxide dismutase, Fe-Mn family